MAASSCRNTDSDIIREVKVKGNILTEINIDKIPDEAREMNLSEIFIDFSIIPLETNENCLIGAYNKKVKIADGNIFFGFHGDNNPGILLRFDSEGNFINRIGTGGRGPGEHRGYDVHSIHPDEATNRVTVEWFGIIGDGPKTYEYDGTYIESISFPEILLGGFYKWSEGEWFSTGNATGNPEYPRDSLIVLFYNNKGEITGRVPRSVYPEPVSNNYTPFGGINVFTIGDNYKLFTPESDTVYILNKEKLIPADVIHRGDDVMPYNKYVDPNSIIGKHDIEIIDETENNYLLMKSVITMADLREYAPGRWGGMFDADHSLIVIDKKNYVASYVKIVDDVFGILPEDPEYFFTIFRDIDEERVSLPIDAIRFLKMVDESGVDLETLAAFSPSPERIKNITTDSNPVIITFTLRDHIKLN